MSNKLFEISVRALSSATRKALANLLERKMLILSDDGYFRDYRGLAAIIGIDKSHRELIETNPLENILHVWELSNENDANLGRLQEILKIIDRRDVIDSTNAMFLQDAQIYQNRKMQFKSISYGSDDQYELLTDDDVTSMKYGLPQVTYDAFILYADEDFEIAKNMIQKLELMHFKVRSKDRDLLPGVQFKYEAILNLIAKRCNRMIVIISAAFFRSHENKFLLNYIHALGIENGYNKIIPCLYENCELPFMLRFYVALNVLHSGNLYNFWDRLRSVLEIGSLNHLAITNCITSNSKTDELSAVKGFRSQTDDTPETDGEHNVIEKVNGGNPTLRMDSRDNSERLEHSNNTKTERRVIVEIHRIPSGVSLDNSKRLENLNSIAEHTKIVAAPTKSPIIKPQPLSMSNNTNESESSLEPVSRDTSIRIRIPNWCKRIIKPKYGKGNRDTSTKLSTQKNRKLYYL